VNQWIEQWDRLVEREQTKQYLQDVQMQKKQTAINKTEDAAKAIEEIKTLLSSRVENFFPLDWNKIKKAEIYRVPKPSLPKLPTFPIEPNKTDPKYDIKNTIGLFDVIFGGKKAKEEKALRTFQVDYHDWKVKVDKLQRQYDEKTSSYQKQIKKWEQGIEIFLKEVRDFNAQIEKIRGRYLSVTKDGVEFHSRLVLEDSKAFLLNIILITRFLSLIMNFQAQKTFLDSKK
jgi:hypothetical protein